MKTFFVPGIPKPKGSFRSFKHKKTGKIVTQNDNNGTKPWQTDMKWYAYREFPSAHEGPMEISLTFHMRQPKKSKYPYGVPVTKPDIDKLARTALDAFTGVIFHDDAQVVSLAVRKIYHANVGVLVEIKYMSD